MRGVPSQPDGVPALILDGRQRERMMLPGLVEGAQREFAGSYEKPPRALASALT